MFQVIRQQFFFFISFNRKENIQYTKKFTYMQGQAHTLSSNSNIKHTRLSVKEV